MSRKIFEPKPRWEGAPRICLYENAPAFKSEKEMGAYHTRYYPACPIYRKWLCPVCNGWHFFADEMPPAGGSSGTQRKNAHMIPRAEREGLMQAEELSK